MAGNNKVEFGLSSLVFGTYVETSDGITLGTPMQVPGAVSLTLENQEEESKFYADNMVYWSSYVDQGFEAEIEVARFPEEFKKTFLGYVTLSDGGISKPKNAVKPNVYFAFQGEGDIDARRVICYNATLGDVQREYKTNESSVEPVTEKVKATVMGMNKEPFLARAIYKPGDAGYDTVLTAPTAPTVQAGE